MSITNNDLTEISLNGSGVADLLIQTTKLHLNEEFQKGRISGPEYSQVYIRSIETCISQGIQFLLQRDAAAKQALLIEKQIEQLDKQNLLLEQQIAAAIIQVQKEEVELEILGKQLLQADIQIAQIEAQTELLNQKVKTEKAQIVDVVDGVQVTGVIGKQKQIYQAQADGFIRDAEQKVAKIFSDLWSVQRSTEDTLLPPQSAQNEQINAVLNKLKQGIGINS